MSVNSITILFLASIISTYTCILCGTQTEHMRLLYTSYLLQPLTEFCLHSEWWRADVL